MVAGVELTPALRIQLQRILGEYGNIVPGPEMLFLDVTYRAGKGVTQQGHAIRLTDPDWEDQVAAVLAHYGQNRIVSLQTGVATDE